ncbi:hypothetical protein VIM7927_00926 [Vibrio mangrovi]|uniref:Uncharacterized protein n=1 Tax=Vibrio mangrovi TaxID=474394 RepID=A0A1Y6IPY7_9VIBR|nr:hypothetical protein VIM7927_00926 [Vibrio mangrovi]
MKKMFLMIRCDFKDCSWISANSPRLAEILFSSKCLGLYLGVQEIRRALVWLGLLMSYFSAEPSSYIFI